MNHQIRNFSGMRNKIIPTHQKFRTRSCQNEITKTAELLVWVVSEYSIARIVFYGQLWIFILMPVLIQRRTRS